MSIEGAAGVGSIGAPDGPAGKPGFIPGGTTGYSCIGIGVPATKDWPVHGGLGIVLPSDDQELGCCVHGPISHWPPPHDICPLAEGW